MRLLLTCALLVGFTSALPWDFSEEDERNTGTTCACGWTNKGRIINGRESQKNAYPLIVALLESGRQVCGGTIINPWHVLTAAHCTIGRPPKDLQVSVGAHDVSVSAKSEGIYQVAKIIDHEEYNTETFVNDISLLVTGKEMKFSQNVGPACLPTQRVNLVGQRIRALGWGDGNPNTKLHEVDLTVVSAQDCITRWRSMGMIPRADTHLCTYEHKKDTCQRDSGGPLIWLDPATNRYTIVALVSYGGTCGGPLPAVNTDVAAFLPWINKHVAASKPGTNTCHKV